VDVARLYLMAKAASRPRGRGVPRSPDHDEFELSVLTMLDPDEDWRAWLTQGPQPPCPPFAPTTYEGRAAWRFEAPEVECGVPTLTVEAERGLMLRGERADIGVLRSWCPVRADVVLGDDQFRYHGPWQLDDHHTYPVGWLPSRPGESEPLMRRMIGESP